MGVYVLILLLIAIGIIGHDIHPGKSGRFWVLFLFLTALVMALVAGFRYNNGIDTRDYAVNFEIVNSDYWRVLTSENPSYSDRFDYVYLAAGRLGGGIWAIQLIFGLLLNGIFAWFAYQNTRRPFLAFLFYFIFCYFNLNFEVMREGGATAIALWAWGNYHRNEYWQYFLKIGLAMMIHYSAAIMLLLPLMHLPLMRKAVRDWRGVLTILAAGLATGLLLRMAAIHLIPAILNILPAGDLKERALYKLQMHLISGVNPLILNWKGYLGYLIGYVGGGVAIWWFLQRRIASGEDNEETLDADFGGMAVLMAAAILATFGFEDFGRLQNYLLLTVAVGFARSVYVKRKIIWAIAMLPLFLFKFDTYMAPVALVGEGYVYNLYIPYSDVFRKNTDEYQEFLINRYYEKAQDKFPMYGEYLQGDKE